MKISGKRTVSWLVVLLFLWIAPLSVCLADMVPGMSAGAGQKTGDVREKAQEQGAAVFQPEEVPVPINAEKIDVAGQALGKKIDAAGRGASLKVGSWINAKAFLGITWLKLFACLGLLLLVIAAERAVHRLVSARLQKSAGGQRPTWGHLLMESLVSPLSLFIKVYGFYWALSPIWIHFDTPAGPNLLHRAAGKAADIGGTVALFWFVYKLVNVMDYQVRKWAASTQNGINDMLAPLMSKTIKGFVIVVGGIMVVQNMTGIEVGPLVASLGIGGLAFALAGKDSIANFLGSITILLDKPFQVGDRIAMEKHDGFVEGVGFRSTRIRTLTGNLVSIPNEKIINSTLENIGKRTYLRWQANLGLTYSTPPEKVERAVEIVKELLADHEEMRPDYPARVFFNGFNDWSLNIAVYAWYFSTDYWKYQAWVERTCLAIMSRFGEEEIEMAFPTHTVYQISQETPTEHELPAAVPMRLSGKR